MLSLSITTSVLAALVAGHPSSQASSSTPPHFSSTLRTNTNMNTNSTISATLFNTLETLARLVDISYCVGTTGISKPFVCASRCHEFPGYELVDTFHTGVLMGDSCGFVVIDHGEKDQERGGERGDGGGGDDGDDGGDGEERRMRGEGGAKKGKEGEDGRIIVAFRGTYSIADTIVDLSTVPQEYVPYPDDPEEDGPPTSSTPQQAHSRWDILPSWYRGRTSQVLLEKTDKGRVEKPKLKHKCTNCTVHTGFFSTWRQVRPLILPHLQRLHAEYPTYSIQLVGHSLGGAVACLAGLELKALGLHPTVTTFGEPRVGNAALRAYVDDVFGLSDDEGAKGEAGNLLEGGRYRRVTHVDDPVPLLPLSEWGYAPHAGEVYISKPSLQPAVSDLRVCSGDEDEDCIAGAEINASWFGFTPESIDEAVMLYNSAYGVGLVAEGDNGDVVREEGGRGEEAGVEKRWGIPIPARYKMWQLFFAHRDYFWRLGLCVPGGDPFDWGRERYRVGEPGEEREEL